MGTIMNGKGGDDNDKVIAAEEWKIIHIPDKPPLAPHLQPTVDVFAAVIQPNYANTIVRKLNHIAPLENLRHVKRVRKKCLDGGMSELSVVLCLTSAYNNLLDGIPENVAELIKHYQLSTFVAKVCKYAASTKEEWEEQCKYWPTSFHPPTYNIAGITGFSEEETHSLFAFMKLAVDLAKSSTSSVVVNAAIIVDPSTKQVISSSSDQVVSSANPKFKSISEASSLSCSAGTTSGETNQVQKLETSDVCSVTCDQKQLHRSVACLHPWQWSEQPLSLVASSWHPLRHAAMVAIEYSAARDKILFPNCGQVEDGFVREDCMLSQNTCLPSKRQKIKVDNVEDAANVNGGTHSSLSDSDRPYLCTGYDIFLVWEPCIMCAMALVHQRVRRIFFAFPNPNAGALGSVHRLQGERSLNHHYAVFRVILPEDMLIKESSGC